MKCNKKISRCAQKVLQRDQKAVADDLPNGRPIGVFEHLPQRETETGFSEQQKIKEKMQERSQTGAKGKTDDSGFEDGQQQDCSGKIQQHHNDVDPEQTQGAAGAVDDREKKPSNGGGKITQNIQNQIGSGRCVNGVRDVQNSQNGGTKQKHDQRQSDIHDGDCRDPVKDLLRTDVLVTHCKIVRSLDPGRRHDAGDNIGKGGGDCAQITRNGKCVLTDKAAVELIGQRRREGQKNIDDDQRQTDGKKNLGRAVGEIVDGPRMHDRIRLPFIDFNEIIMPLLSYVNKC